MAKKLRLVGRAYRRRLLATKLSRVGPDLRLFAAAALVVLAMTIRGGPGSPSPADIQASLSSPGSTFETSQERSRWAAILSLFNQQTFAIDSFESIAAPDVVSAKGHFYSSLPPGASVAALPLYALGTYIGATQIVVYGLQAALLLATMLLMFQLGLALHLGRRVALFSAVAFGFATNAWGYSVTLSGYPLATLLLLAGCCLVCTGRRLQVRQFLGFWLVYGLAILVENSSFFTFLPLVAAAAGRLRAPLGLAMAERKRRKALLRSLGLALSPLGFAAGLFLFGWYNAVHFGSPFALSSAIPRAGGVNPGPVTGVLLTPGLDINPRGFAGALSILVFSTERGLLFYAPVALLAVFGWQALSKRSYPVRVALAGVPLVALAVHLPLQDPYGGWAFGPRYLIPALPELCLLAGLGLQRFARTDEMKLVYSAAFLYSAAVSLLAPLTTNAIPPSVEAPGVLASSYLATFGYLSGSHLSSALYNAAFATALSGWEYYVLILVPVLAAGLYLIWTCSSEASAPWAEPASEAVPHVLLQSSRGGPAYD